MDKSWMTMSKTLDGRLSHPYIEGTKRSELGIKRHELSKKRSKRIFLTF